MSLGKRIKHLRLGKELSQEELANFLGTKRATLGNWELERVKPDYETIKAIAEFFNVTTDYLLGASEEKSGKADINFILTDGRTINDLNEMLNELTPDDQQLIFNMIESLSKRMKK